MAEVVKHLCDALEIVKVEAAPWSPWSSGKVEKWNKTLKETLAKELRGESNEWDKLVPLVTFYYNCSVNVTTGVSPFELATGRMPVMPANLAMGLKEAKTTPNEYVNETIDKMTKLSRMVFETTKQQKAYQQRDYNKRIHGEPLKVGDLVRVRYHGRPPRDITTKLLPRWRGPFRIAEKLGDRTYVVEMSYRGRIVPRVQNIRNLFKVGEEKSEQRDETLEDMDIGELWANEDETRLGEVDGEASHGLSRSSSRIDREPVPETSGNEAGRSETVTSRFGRTIKRPARFMDS